MIVVAVVAVTLGAVAIERRRARLREIADYHDGMLRHLRSLNASMRGPHGTVPSPRLVSYHDRMAKKYRLAASRPWLPADPDPPQTK
jgi:hypothetical protein